MNNVITAFLGIVGRGGGSRRGPKVPATSLVGGISESPWQQARRRYFAGRMGPWGLYILVGIFIFVVIGSILLPFDFYNVPQPDEINFIGRGPAWGRPFGETGLLQLDVLTLVVNGGKTSLAIGFLSALGGISIGTFIGVISGFFGGRVDSFLMRLTDIFLMIPSLFVILFLVALFVRKALAKAVVILLLGALIVVSLSQRANISKCATRIQNEYKDGLGGPATCKFFGRQFKVEVPATVPDDSSGLSTSLTRPRPSLLRLPASPVERRGDQFVDELTRGSGVRHMVAVLERDELRLLRRDLLGRDPVQAMEAMLTAMKKFPTNAEFLASF